MSIESKHDEIAVLVMAVERLAESLAKTNDKVDKLVEAMGKQEVLIEKLANIEKAHADSMTRVHKRIDLNEKNIADIKKIQQSVGCGAHQSAVSRYDQLVKQSIDDRADFKEYMRENEKWKLSLYKVLIGKAFLIIAGLISVVYTNLVG